MDYMCRSCGVVLRQGENWYGRGTSRGRMCHPCFRDYQRRWKQTPTGRASVRRHTHWVRQNYLGQVVDGKKVYIRVVGKRAHPGTCEVCGRADRRLAYHHWDDANYSLGLWLCGACHNIAEAVDDGLHKKYLDAKAVIGIQTK